MSFSVTMPALGESVSEGTITRWLKQEGDRVEVDEPLLEVSTDKVDTEIPSPAAGVVQRIVVAEDETVAVGAELAVIGDEAEAGADGGGQPAEDQAAEAVEPSAPSQPSPEPEQPVQAAQPPGVAEPAPPDQATQGAPSSPQGGGGSGAGRSVTMPALGESVSEGTVTRWLKQIGERVEVDEPLLEVSTDKVDTEIPSPVAGFLVAITVGEDETVAVGAELARIADSSEAGAEPAASAGREASAEPKAEPAAPEAREEPATSPEPVPDSAPAPAAVQTAAPTAPEASAVQASAPAPQQDQALTTAAPAPEPPSTTSSEGPPASTAGDGAAYVTPLVRKLAAEHGVELSSLRGSGVGGRLRKQDVLAAAQEAESKPAAPEPAARAAAAQAGRSSAPATVPESPLRGTTAKMSRLRKVIATRMVESLRISAQLTTVAEVDVTRIARLREQAKADFEAREGVHLSFLPFFAKAAVDTLKGHPKLNASIIGDEIVYHGAEHLGIAVDTDRGLLVPVIKDAGDLNIAGLARKIADLAQRARDSKIVPDELGGGTFTLTNTGSRGPLFDTPIIHQPQVGILGTGGVVKRAAVVDHPDLGEVIAVRHVVYLALSYDHRLVDGADAARFLVAVGQRLEEARFEADLGISSG